MDVPLLAVTALLFVALAAACLLPVSADGTEDCGDGRGQVVIPPPVKTPPYRPRTWIFLGVTAVLSLVFLGWRNPSPPAAYAGWSVPSPPRSPGIPPPSAVTWPGSVRPRNSSPWPTSPG